MAPRNPEPRLSCDRYRDGTQHRSAVKKSFETTTSVAPIAAVLESACGKADNEDSPSRKPEQSTADQLLSADKPDEVLEQAQVNAVTEATDWSLIPFPPRVLETETESVKPPRLRKNWNNSSITSTLLLPLRSPFSLSANSPNRIHGGTPPRHLPEDSGTCAELIERLNRLQLTFKAISYEVLCVSKLPNEIWMCIFEFITAPKDLLAMMLTCKLFCAWTIPLLYSSIRVRMPFWTHEFGLSFGSYFDNGSIPFNHFLEPLGGIKVEIYPKICNLIHYVRHLDLTGYWDIPRRHQSFVGIPQIIRNNLAIYDLYKESDSNGYITIWSGTFHNVQIPPQNMYDALSFMLRQMINLKTFKYLPYRDSLSPWNVSINTIITRGWYLAHKKPYLGSPVLEALKKMPKLKELAVDFEQSDPLVYGRATNLPPVSNYNPVRMGLVGFKNLSKLDVRGVSEPRLQEIAVVVADCIDGGDFKALTIEIEKWWSIYMENMEIDDETSLWDWIQRIWERTIGRAKVHPWMDMPTIDVKITLINFQWEFKTYSDFNFRTECLTVLRIYTAGFHKETISLLKRLKADNLPNLKKLTLRCFIADCYPLLKTTTGLQELMIIGPVARPLPRIYLGGLDQTYFEQRVMAFTEDQMKPDISKTNWMLDTIAKRHLRTLEVLVIDQSIPIPRSFTRRGSINSLDVWKARGNRIKELGLNLWMAPSDHERLTAFISCFPALKYLHYFNTPEYSAIQPIPMAPRSFQIPATEFFYGSYFYNALNMAAILSHIWSKDLLTSKSNGLDSLRESTRYIGVGPWWIRTDAGYRWRWDEDKAKKLYEWKERPYFCGKFFTSPIPLNLSMPKARNNEYDDSRMWSALSRCNQ